VCVCKWHCRERGGGRDREGEKRERAKGEREGGGGEREREREGEREIQRATDTYMHTHANKHHSRYSSLVSMNYRSSSEPTHDSVCAIYIQPVLPKMGLEMVIRMEIRLGG